MFVYVKGIELLLRVVKLKRIIEIYFFKFILKRLFFVCRRILVERFSLFCVIFK